MSSGVAIYLIGIPGFKSGQASKSVSIFFAMAKLRNAKIFMLCLIFVKKVATNRNLPLSLVFNENVKIESLFFAKLYKIWDLFQNCSLILNFVNLNYILYGLNLKFENVSSELIVLAVLSYISGQKSYKISLI